MKKYAITISLFAIFAVGCARTMAMEQIKNRNKFDVSNEVVIVINRQDSKKTTTEKKELGCLGCLKRCVNTENCKKWAKTETGKSILLLGATAALPVVFGIFVLGAIQLGETYNPTM